MNSKRKPRRVASSGVFLIYGRLSDGSEPAREFLYGLDRKMRAKMYREINLLVMNGPELREPHSKCFNDGIFELRAKQGSDISRVLYFFDQWFHKENHEGTK